MLMANSFACVGLGLRFRRSDSTSLLLRDAIGRGCDDDDDDYEGGGYGVLVPVMADEAFGKGA